jgi:hypothetical protein
MQWREGKPGFLFLLAVLAFALDAGIEVMFALVPIG